MTDNLCISGGVPVARGSYSDERYEEALVALTYCSRPNNSLCTKGECLN